MTKGKDPLIGTRVRDYEILDLIGKGGMGAVYRGRHVYLDEERAIKVIHGRLAGDKDFVDRFIREAKILIKLRHPNLVQLFEFGTLLEDTFFMVLELIRGESVLNRIRAQGKIGVPEAIKIIREGALGLHSAHQKGIVHRDISPDNLMLVKDEFGVEVTKVLDFGIAKPLLEATQHFTVTNMFIGKPEYCSPEQCGVLEDGEVIDHRSDIYSLAITLYHMLSGALPFSSRSPAGYLLKHANEIPKPVSSQLPPGTVPPKLDALILKALAKKREERQQTMEEFVRELDRVFVIDTQPIPDSATAAISTELKVGSMFARRYNVEAKLGEGGMGAVYKATDRILEVPVALKILNMRHYDQKSIEHLKREVVLTRKVSHPNVGRIYDIGESEGIHYVSMEYLEGKTLADMVRAQKRIQPKVGLPIIRQVLAALQEAHRVGIVHRDLKPHNIMVDFALKTFLMDFGISISSDSERITKTGMFIGTPFYMSPEQLEGKDVDLRADIYSVGVIMYEMFTGRLPFTGTAPMAIIFAHMKEIPTRPSQVAPDISPELEAVILKALEKDPNQRYQNCKDFLRALDPLLPGTTSVLSDDQLVHRLVAERSYSRAIKLLHVMIVREPANQKWQKLLHIAASEKLKRDLKRVRSLIHKKNLIQAQLLLEKVSRQQVDNPRATTHIRKLKQLLQENQVTTVESYLGEAEEKMEEQDWLAAGAALEAAWNMKANDPRVIKLSEKLQAMQPREEAQVIAEREAPVFIKDQEPLPGEIEIEEQVLQPVPDPRYLDAYQRGHELFEQSRWVEAMEQWELALQFQPEDESARGWVGAARDQILKERELKKQMEQHLTSAEQCLAQQDFAQARKLLDGAQAMISANAGLQYHEDRIARLSQQLEDVIQTASREEETAVRTFQEAFNKGKEAYDQERWSAALDAFRLASRILPGEPMIKQWIDVAERQIQQEAQVQATRENTIRTTLQEVSQLSQRKDYEAGLKIIDALLQREPGLDRAVALKKSILAERETARQEAARTAPTPQVVPTRMPVSETPSLGTGEEPGPNYVLWGSIAAVIAIVLIVGGWLFLRPRQVAEVPVATQKQPPATQVTQQPDAGKTQVPAPVPAPTPVTPATTSFEIRSSPSSASIVVDGKDTGLRTPATLELTTSPPHRLEVKLDGYEPFKGAVDKDTPLHLEVYLTQMQQLPATISYQGDFPVSIYNGKTLLMDSSSTASTQLPSGAYTLTLSSTKNAFINDVRSVTVSPGQKTILKAPPMGTVTMSANPSNCNIYMDGIFLDLSPIFDYPVQSGAHSIRFVWPKLNLEKTKSVSLNPGQTKSVNAIIENNAVNIYEEVH
jgi:serine/threonine protein kinase